MSAKASVIALAASFAFAAPAYALKDDVDEIMHAMAEYWEDLGDPVAFELAVYAIHGADVPSACRDLQAIALDDLGEAHVAAYIGNDKPAWWEEGLRDERGLPVPPIIYSSALAFPDYEAVRTVDFSDGSQYVLSQFENDAFAGCKHGSDRALRTPEPNPEATPEPTLEPTPEPTPEPTLEPTPEPTATAGLVSGAILLPDGSTLNRAAAWSVELQDTSLADAPAKVISADSGAITDTMAAEIPFEIRYDHHVIDDRFTYTLSARIVDAEDDLLFINDTVVPVITHGSPTEDVAVPVVDVSIVTGSVEPSTAAPAAGTAIVADFMCQDLATARTLLAEARLVAGAIIPTDPPPGDDWVLLDQLPGPGGSVPVGSKVDLMLGDPLAPCPPWL